MNKTNNLVKKIVEPIHVYIYRSHAIDLKNLIKKTRSIRTIGFIASFCLLLLAFLSVSPIILKESVVEGASPVESITTLSMTTGHVDASVDLIPSNKTGTFSKSTDDEMAKFEVTTNNYTGYKLQISALDDSGLLINTTTGTALSSIASSIDENTFDTTPSNNTKWGYMPKIYNSATSSYDSLTSGNYLKSPTTTATTINTTNCANNTTLCPNTVDSYAISLGARADYTIPSGTYTNTFVLNVTANPVAYAITYGDATGDSTVVNLPTTQTSDSTAVVTSVILAPDKIPTRADYIFKAWCEGTVNTTGDGPGTVCTGTEYQAGDSFNLDQTSGNEITLYAVWSPYIQNITDSMCTTTPMLVYDKRDEQAYTIQKLNDNNCWMMNNLNLGATDLSQNLTSSNTNISTSSTITAATFNSWKKSAGTESFTSPEFIPVTAANSTTGSDTDPVTGTKYGTLYNYCAASAGTYCYSNTDSTNYGNNFYDLCPAGWRLPTGGSSGEFQALYDVYNTIDKIHNPISSGGAAFAFSGGFGAEYVPRYQGTNGMYWSSTRYSNTYMYRMEFSTTSVLPSSNYIRNVGNAIRCVLSPTTIKTLNYMQDFNKLDSIKRLQVKNSMISGTAYTLNDARDSNAYQIKKLGNGYISMASDLKFTGTTLISATSNVASTYKVNNGSGYYSLSGTSASSSSGNCYGVWTASDETAAGNGLSKACMYSSGNKVWYNFAAASAGTITGTANYTMNSSYDICPAGWRLPTQSEQTGSGGINTYISQYTPSVGGYYDLGAVQNSARGYWWASTLRGNVTTTGKGSSRYLMEYVNSSTVYAVYRQRAVGAFIRCLVK